MTRTQEKQSPILFYLMELLSTIFKYNFLNGDLRKTEMMLGNTGKNKSLI